MFTIIDIAYTGTSPRRDCIVEMALVKHDGQQIIATWHSYIQPPKPLSTFTLAMLHLSPTELADAPPFAQLSQQLATFLKGTILVGFHIRRTYALLRQAFKQTDEKTWRCKQICLTQLVDQHFPLTHPKTMAAVCKDFDIVFNRQLALENRVQSITKIFEQLLLTKPNSLQKKQLSNITAYSSYPPYLSPEKVANLPEGTGVYYFLDHKGKILYLGKSIQIRKRILSHFTADLQSSKKQKLKEQIYDIQYKLTGSELIALLLESDEIKRFMPRFNRAQRRKRYSIGIYIQTNEEGYLQLHISPLQLEGKPFMLFSSRWQAMSFVLYQAKQFQLNLSLCGLASFEQWFTQIGVEEADFPEELLSVAAHNEKMQRLIAHHQYPSPDLLLIDKGRNETEASVVFIEDQQYLGYAYVPVVELPESTAPTISIEAVQVLKKHLIPFRNNPDVQQIIQAYLRKEGTGLRQWRIDK